MTSSLAPVLAVEAPLHHSPKIRIRRARLEDERDVHDACFPERKGPHHREQYQRLLRWQSSGRVVVAVAEDTQSGKIVGCGHILFRRGFAEIADLSVETSRQGEGIGTAIISAFIELATALGIPRLEIGATSRNHAALSLYRRLGFQDDRSLVAPGDGLAIILSKLL